MGEHEAKVQEALEDDEAVAEVVDEAVIEIRKREAEEEEEAEAEIEETMVEKDDEAKSEEKMVYAHGQLFGQPLQYSFHPYLGFVPNVVANGERRRSHGIQIRTLLWIRTSK